MRPERAPAGSGGGGPMSRIVSLLAIAVVSAGTAFDRRRRERIRLARPGINRWEEEEGGAVPIERTRTAAQTRIRPQTA